jgi:hypothetical protein
MVRCHCDCAGPNATRIVSSRSNRIARGNFVPVSSRAQKSRYRAEAPVRHRFVDDLAGGFTRPCGGPRNPDTTDRRGRLCIAVRPYLSPDQTAVDRDHRTGHIVG